MLWAQAGGNARAERITRVGDGGGGLSNEPRSYITYSLHQFPDTKIPPEKVLGKDGS